MTLKEYGKKNPPFYIAERIDGKKNIAIAHYHCELAEIFIQADNLKRAAKSLQQALKIDPKCARANLLSAKVEANLNDHENAIKHLKNIKKQNPDFFAEAVLPLAENYRALDNDLKILHRLTQKLLDDHAPYQCINCGFSAKKIHWLCPSCRQWSMIKPTHALD